MSAPPATLRVWDLPIRLFHWLLTACLIGSFVTVKAGGFWMDYHLLFGYATLGLLLFRGMWGVVGPDTARFGRFVRGPRALSAYLRGSLPAAVGHSPLGALSVVAMLIALAVQVVSGLFADDGIFTAGPLAGLVSAGTSDTLTAIHQAGERILLVLIGLHLSAIGWYVIVRRRRMVRPMLTGDQLRTALPSDARASRDDAAMRWRAVGVALVAAGITAWVVNLGGSGGF